MSNPNHACSQPSCTYCGAPDNGTCAYPSEGRPGCVRDARLKRGAEWLRDYAGSSKHTIRDGQRLTALADDIEAGL
jgi:hypothetical protein